MMLHENPTSGQYFGDVLKAFMRRTPRDPRQVKWTARALAKRLGQRGLDEGLVGRWLRNDRVPKLESPYIAQISEVLELLPAERQQLENAQVFSLRAHARRDSLPPRTPAASASNFANSTSPDRPFSPPLPLTTRELPRRSLHSGVVALHSPDEVTETAIRLFEDARQQYLPEPHGRTIYLTFQGPHSTPAFDSKLGNLWQRALRSALQSGWDVCHVLRLDQTVARTLGLAKDMLGYLNTRGTYQPCYLTDRDTLLSPYDLVLVPGVGGLICFATQQTMHIDAAIAVVDQQQLAVLEEHARLLSSPPEARRLLNSYYRRDDLGNRDYREALIRLEQSPGGRFCVKPDGLSALTRPRSFLNDESTFFRALSPEAQANLVQEMTARWAAFERYNPVYTYSDICSKRAVLRYVKHGIVARDDTDLAGSGHERRRASPHERLAHLRNVVQMLQLNNYRLALPDNAEERDLLTSSQWSVVGDIGLLLETWQLDERSGEQVEVDVEIIEPTVTRAFHAYGEEMWRKISTHNREKTQVLVFLQFCIQRLEEGRHEEIDEAEDVSC